MSKYNDFTKHILNIGLTVLTVASIGYASYSLIDSSHKEVAMHSATRQKDSAMHDIVRNDPNVNSEIAKSLNINLKNFNAGEYNLNELSNKNEKVTEKSNIEKIIKKNASQENKILYEQLEQEEANAINEHDEASNNFFLSAGIAIAGIIKLKRDSNNKKAKENSSKTTTSEKEQ